eukprot:3825442-Prymnesium_polylepis.1
MLPSQHTTWIRQSTSRARGQRVNDGEMRPAKPHRARSDRPEAPAAATAVGSAKAASQREVSSEGRVV